MRFRMTSAVALCLAAFALAACDTTPPVFKVPTHVGFVVGSQIGPSDHTDDDSFNDFTSPISRVLRWSATDNDYACPIRYDVERVYVGIEPTIILENARRKYLYEPHTDYNGDFGGGSAVVGGWNVIARDCSGNETVSGNILGSNVWQENGQNPRTPRLPPTITWSGTWGTQKGPWASGGLQRYTSQRNASVSFRKEFLDGQHIGLVMAKGPGRGSADIYVDNVKVGTVDTNAAANDNRRIVFDRQLTGGVHTVRIVNKATAGHARIDVDAFLT